VAILSPMATSLLELSRGLAGTDFPRATASEISYPDFGAKNLAAMEQHHFWFTERRELTFRALSEHLRPGSVGADIGCGTGYTAVWLSERNYPTIGIDALPGFLPLRNSGRGAGFVQTDLMQCELEPEFDFIVLLDTLEHIRDDGDFLNHVIQMVKPGGYIFISVPAFQWLWSPVDDTSGHFRRYTKKSLAAIVPARTSRVFSMYFYASLLPLFLAARTLAKKNGGNAPASEYNPSPLVNRVCSRLLKWERSLFYPRGLPVGSSLFTLLKKEIA
jgi:2-polyprenyl-3-methyl-5-hydroxy-6-metoxy-1,4-benzoquinol methylase